ncbi:DUF6516 family protein [Geminocystis sp.]|uniref:toxin-antitoxin system TumE family protein n=1 Tax=Geminocystis sp. TaxID=2664100 RepID=UPI0035942D84
MIAQEYINQIKLRLKRSKVVDKLEIIKEKVISDQGYFRAKIILENGDFLEVAEFFKVENKQCITVTYRYQWMSENKQQLRKRWDNVEHFSDLANFPHHVHIDNEFTVKPSELRNIIQIMNLIETKININ